MSREQELKELCTRSLLGSDLRATQYALKKASRKDVTQEYAEMLEAFECDFSIARDDSNPVGLDALQIEIEHGDERTLKHIDLLEKLSFGIRHGFIKIIEEEAGHEQTAAKKPVKGEKSEA